MPALTTCVGTSYEQHWNVASDDFVLPAFLSVVTSLFSTCLIVAVLFTLYIAPGCVTNPVPPLLYGSFFALLVVIVITAINETVILSLSSKGSVLDVVKPRRHITKFVYIKVLLSIAEFIALMACTVSISHKKVKLELECDGFDNALKLSLAVVVIQWVVFAGLLIKTALYVDPCGLFSPGLLERLSMFDDSDNKGSFVISTARAGFDSDTTLTEEQRRRQRTFERTDSYLKSQILTANNLHYWETKRARIFSANISQPSFDKIKNDHSKVHNAEISRRKLQRRLQVLCCCLGIGGHRSRGVALDDVARGLYTIFSETDVVLSDVIAGFHLLHRHQKRKCRKGKSIVDKFRKVIFRMMPSQQRHNLSPNECRPAEDFDFSDVEKQIVFEDLVHYMHYAMGIYGWPLHLFDNMLCGLCQLCSVTCCRCQYRCLSKRAKEEGGDFIKELGCCMCGMGVMRLQTGVKPKDIIYMNKENKIYGAPFSVSVDSEMKSVVISVRGTLSLRDTLTDMSFSPLAIYVGGVKEAYVHGGMLRAALLIQQRLKEKNILARAFKGHEGYQLVVTGHSLGAGVASVLSLLLKLQKWHLVCYAYSPPGALFSFPLAEYSTNFITSVVVGNDIVPRITLRALLHLKFSVQHQLTSCREPKYKILLMPGWYKKLQRGWNKFSRERRERRGVQSDGGEGGEEVDGGGVEGEAEEEEEEEDDIEDQVVNEFTTQEWLRSELFSRQQTVCPPTESTDGGTSQQSRQRQLSRPYLKTPSRQYARQTSHQYMQERQHSKPAVRQHSTQETQELMLKFRRATSIELLGDEIPASHFQAAPDHGGRTVADDASFDEPDSGISLHQETPKSIPSPSPRPTEPLKQEEPLPPSSSLPLPPPPEIQQQQQQQQQPTTTERLQSFTADTFRASEVCTPGSAIHSAVPNIFEHCRNPEGDTFLPSFPPGRILHIEFPPQTPTGCVGLCQQSELQVKEVPAENFSVIVVDQGIIDDHLPNRVLHHLKVCKAQHLETNPKYNPEQIKEEREIRYKARKRLFEDRPATPSNDPFQFVVHSPDGTVTNHRSSYLLEREREQRLQRQNLQELRPIEEEGLTDTTSLSSRVEVEVHHHDDASNPPSSNHEPTRVNNGLHLTTDRDTQLRQHDRPSVADEDGVVSGGTSMHHLNPGASEGLTSGLQELSASPGGARLFKDRKKKKREKFVLSRQENVIGGLDGAPHQGEDSGSTKLEVLYSTVNQTPSHLETLL